MELWKMMSLSKGVSLRFHVKFQGCIPYPLNNQGRLGARNHGGVIQSSMVQGRRLG